MSHTLEYPSEKPFQCNQCGIDEEVSGILQWTYYRQINPTDNKNISRSRCLGSQKTPRYSYKVKRLVDTYAVKTHEN